ncbi:cytochrome-c peroxidase [Myxococcus qinghaiensis]|uniref:cytochrome-c peroxidase n=1 Tax=Myxococcus qinghaiensis TaxID=2906758 RepID=UPI0020A79F62|nr:cytochrome c peroxidase [Myxococcus qinghaiensis]MCP3170228.1 c-type cytochrome [Myxococcus qinghaiensis]
MDLAGSKNMNTPFSVAAWTVIVLLAPALSSGAERVISPEEGAQAALGKELFFDESLSVDGKVACGTCHLSEAAFAGRDAIAHGAFGKAGTRNAPSLLGLTYVSEFFWDGRRASLEALVLDPLITVVEHGYPDIQSALSAVRARHAAGFARIFPVEGVTPETVAAVLSAYVRSLESGPSAFERYSTGEANALSPSQRRGFSLFIGRAACSRCHHLDGGRFTDGAYHVGEMAADLASRLAAAAQDISHMSLEERQARILERVDVAALGRYVVTLRPADIGRFRTPSLRNVALTAPYMHDGSVPTLAGAVERELYYHAGNGVRVGDLTPADRADLVAFLQTLTSSETPRAAAVVGPPTHPSPSKRTAQ